jgi:hypothetical protein
MNTDAVDRDTATFNSAIAYYWNVSLRMIGGRPQPQRGTVSERALAISPFPTMTFQYEITAREYESGEVVHLFSSSFLPRTFVIAYVLDEWAEPAGGFDGEVRVIFVRTD